MTPAMFEVDPLAVLDDLFQIIADPYCTTEVNNRMLGANLPQPYPFPYIDHSIVKQWRIVV